MLDYAAISYTSVVKNILGLITRQMVKRRKYQKAYVSRARNRALAVLGRKCRRCGFLDARALQIDHCGGGGVKELKSIGSYAVYRKVVVSRGEGYQLLCANCNWIKRAENNEHRGGERPAPMIELTNGTWRQITAEELEAKRAASGKYVRSRVVT